MKNKIFLLSVLFLFVSINFTFAAGKITPFNWDTPKNPDEFLELEETENATSTDIGIASVTLFGLSSKIIQPDGTIKNISSLSDLEKGGEIIVGPGSTMIITLNDGSEITLTNFDLIETQIRIMSELFDKANQLIDKGINEFNLLQGKFKAKVIKRLGQKFTVRTPNAVTSVRGTEFIVTHDPDINITNVYLKEGVVDVDNLHGKIIQLQVGESVSVDSDGKTVVSELNIDEWDELSNKEVAENLNLIPVKKPTSIYAWIISLMIIIGGWYMYKKKKAIM